MKKGGVLLLTAGFGEGHNAAARSLKAAADSLNGEECAQIYDVFAEARPSFNRWMRTAYLELINRFPSLWSKIYRDTCHREIPGWFWRTLRKETATLNAHILRSEPAVLCSTYPVYSFLLRHAQSQQVRTIPHFVVVTDSISVHSLWWQAGAREWLLPNEESADVLRQAGISEARLQVAGFPVSPFFSAQAGTLSPPDLGGGARPRVLYLVHSGSAAAGETARKLLQETDWEVTCAVGRNEGLRRSLETLAASRGAPARILGWTPEVPALLMTHHAVISKAGGATTQEAIAAGCPMIVNQIVPGQEEGNYELLRRLGAGSHARTPSEALSILKDWFAGNGEGWRGRRARLCAVARPEASAQIAGRLLPFLRQSVRTSEA